MRKHVSVVWLSLLGTPPAFAASSVWQGPDVDFNTASNWSAGVPTDVAEFRGNVPASPMLTAPENPGSPVSNGAITLNAIAFDADASPYTLTLSGTARHAVLLTLAGAGITNASSNNQQMTNDGGSIVFTNAASAGRVNFTNESNSIDQSRGQITFEGSSSAGQATILNRSATTTTFNGQTNAGSAQITNSAGTVVFNDQSNAGQSILINMDSTFGNSILFTGSASGGQASIVNNGARSKVDISGLTTSGMSVGSIDGGGTFNLGSKNLTLTASDGPHSVSGLITGVGGSLTIDGNQALTVSGVNTYSGPTLINAGSLYVSGALPGAVTVSPGAQLGGTGSVGAVRNNGTVAPEHLSTLHVTSYSGPGTLAIDFENERHSALDVTETADVTGGTLLVAKGLPFKAGGYSVVHAGTVSGTFGTFQHPDSAFLTFQDRYTPTDVFVDINDNGTTFTSVGQNNNQTSVGTVLDAIKNTDAPTPLQDTINTIVQMPVDQVRSAFSVLSGDALTYFQSVNLQGASLMDHQMNERAHPASSVVTAGITPLQVAYNGDIRDLGALNSSSPQNGAWARGVGYFAHTDADSSVGSPSAKATTGGAQAGYDHKVGDHGLLGVAGGYAHTTLNVGDRASSGNSDAHQGGVYGSYTPGHWFLNGSGAYTQADNKMTRGIDLSGISAQADSSFKSRTYTGFGEVGYGFRPQERLSLEPSVAVEYNHVDQDGFTETGAPGFDLTVANQKIDSVVSSVGARIARLFFADGPHATVLGVRGAWQHEYRDINNQITARFAETPIGDFVVQGTPQNRNAAALGIDGRVDLAKNLQAFANYGATLSTGRTDHSLLGGLSLKW